jgi:hypothetical protein
LARSLKRVGRGGHVLAGIAAAVVGHLPGCVLACQPRAQRANNCGSRAAATFRLPAMSDRSPGYSSSTWPDPRNYLRDPEGFRRMLRPARRCCTAAAASPGRAPATCRRTAPSAAATGYGSAHPSAATPASSTSACCPRSSAPSGATSPSCATIRGSTRTPPSAMPPALSTRRCAIYPDVVCLAAGSLRAHTASHHAAP